MFFLSYLQWLNSNYLKWRKIQQKIWLPNNIINLFKTNILCQCALYASSFVNNNDYYLFVLLCLLYDIIMHYQKKWIQTKDRAVSNRLGVVSSSPPSLHKQYLTLIMTVVGVYEDVRLFVIWVRVKLSFLKKSCSQPTIASLLNYLWDVSYLSGSIERSTRIVCYNIDMKIWKELVFSWDCVHLQTF